MNRRMFDRQVDDMLDQMKSLGRPTKQFVAFRWDADRGLRSYWRTTYRAARAALKAPPFTELWTVIDAWDWYDKNAGQRSEE